MRTLLVGSGMKHSALLVTVLVGCSAGTTGAGLDKADVAQAGKSDDAASYCASLGKPADCDICEEMGWYDDGACDTFCRRRDPDCPSIPSDISTHLSGDAPLVHPTLGIWVLHRPGVFAGAAWFPSAEALRASNLSFVLEPMTCSIELGVSLVDRCAEMGSPTLCMLSSGEGEQPVTKVFDELEAQDLSTASQETRSRARSSEQLIEHRVENDGAYIDFYYGEVEARTYLLVIDASDDCSS